MILLYDFVWTDLRWPNSWKFTCATMRIILRDLLRNKFVSLLHIQSLIFAPHHFINWARDLKLVSCFTVHYSVTLQASK